MPDNRWNYGPQPRKIDRKVQRTTGWNVDGKNFGRAGHSLRPIVGSAGGNLTSIEIGPQGYNIVDPDNPGTVNNFSAGSANFNLLSKQSLTPIPYNGFYEDFGMGPVWVYNTSARGQGLWIKFASPLIVGIPSNDFQFSTGGHIAIGAMVLHLWDAVCTFTATSNGDELLEENCFGTCGLSVDPILFDYDPTTLCFSNSPPLPGYAASLSTDFSQPDPYQTSGFGGDNANTEICIQSVDGAFLGAGQLSTSNAGTAADNRDSWIPFPARPNPARLDFIDGPQGVNFFQVSIEAQKPKTAGDVAAQLIGQELAFPYGPQGIANTRGFTITGMGVQGDPTSNQCNYTLTYSPATPVPPFNPNNYTTEIYYSYPIYGVAITVNSSGSTDFPNDLPANVAYGLVQAIFSNLDYAHGGAPQKEICEIFQMGNS